MGGVATAIIAGAAVGAIGTAYSANRAAKAQGKATEATIDEQRAQFEAMQRTLKPYVDAGTPALQQLSSYSQVAQPALEEQQALSGMLGPQAQQEAITRIEQSPLYLSHVAQGENAMLQQASATGGLRGGNIQGALAQFRPAVLQQMIEDKYSKMGGMVGFGSTAAQNLATMGQASAAGQASAGMGMASNIGNALQNQGVANAQAQLARGQAWGNVGGSLSYLGGMGMQGFGPLGGTAQAVPPAAGFGGNTGAGFGFTPNAGYSSSGLFVPGT